MFLVVYGSLTIQFEDRDVHLGPGQFCVVPKKTRHNPVAREDACSFMRRVAAIEISRCTHCATGHWLVAREQPADRAALAREPPKAYRGPP